MKALAILVVVAPATSRAGVPQLAPTLYEHGNLRVAIACADHGLMTPEDGLRVSLDGTSLAPVNTNALTGVGADDDGNPIVVSVVTDAGFLAPPGPHRLRIEAPDCLSDERDVELSATYAEHIAGRLDVSDDNLRGAAVAPNGFGLVFGASMTPLAPGVATDAAVSLPAFWFSTTVERRSWLFAADSMAGWSSLDETMPIRATGSVLATMAAFRVGRRLARDRYALAVGTGLGFGLWSVSLQPDPNAPLAMRPPDGISVDWNVPLWSSLTIKPSCNWGVVALASYALRPTDVATSSLALAVGLQWQPSSACSEAPSLAVSP